MVQTGSISLLLRDMNAGREFALATLHGRCWPWLCQTARRRLGGVRLQSADEEDVAQEAFWGFVQCVRQGRVPQLANRHDLFALLTHIVACKTASHIDWEFAVKRGGGKVINESSLLGVQESLTFGLDQHPAAGLAPSQIILLQESYDTMINSLPESIRLVAELHVAGFSNREIADRLACVERTVERKLSVARKSWQEQAARAFDR